MKAEAELAVKQTKLPFLLASIGKKAPKQPIALEQLIAGALKDNPDVRVAGAKVREAESEAHRVRIRVATDLQGVLAEIEIVEIGVKEALLKFNNTERLFEKKAISREELSNAILSYTKAKAELVAKQGKLPYLLGKSVETQKKVTHVIDEKIQKAWEQNINDAKITDDEFIRRATLDILGRTPQPQEVAKFKTLPDESRRRLLINELFQSVASPAGAARQPAGVDSIWMDGPVKEKLFPKLYRDTPMTDKLRKVLDTPIKLKVNEVDATELLDHLHNEFTGVNLQVRYKAPKNQKVTINFREPVPKGAFLQCLEDELHCVFILRDYGVVVVPADEKLPPGAIRVTDFWKQPRSKDVKPETKSVK
jgi:hypothetical protein